MSTDHKTRVPDEYLMTTYYGGTNKGRCLQISGTTHTEIHPTTKESVDTGRYTQLTVDEAKAMIKDLKDFIKDKLPESP